MGYRLLILHKLVTCTQHTSFVHSSITMSSFSKEEVEEFKAEAISGAFDPVCSDDEEDVAEKDNFNGWVEDEDDGEEFKSLFCDKTFKTIRDLIDHDKGVYGFDLEAVVHGVVTDDVSFIKLINYIRASVKSWDDCNVEKVSHLHEDIVTNKSFSDDKYMIPQLENDVLLFFFEEAFPFIAEDEA